MLHTFAAKIRERSFVENKEEVSKFFESVCQSLPCEACKKEADQYMKRYPDIGSTKAEFITYNFNFHTSLNVKLRKTYFPREYLERYNKADIRKIFPLFTNRYEMPASNKTFISEHEEWFD